MNGRYSQRYARQVTLFGQEKQAELARARVGVIGAGGLGSPVLMYLAAAGVGALSVIDDDTVELSNLHRQVIHSTSRLGQPKAESAAQHVRELNPEVQITGINKRLTWANAHELLAGVDIIVDGADNFHTRHLASAVAARAGIPHVWGSILGFEAQMSVFHAGHGPIYEDLYPTPPAPGSVPTCAQAGVLGPLVGVVGSAMAMETLKLLTGLGSPMLGRVGYFDSLSGTWEYLPLVADPATTERVLTSPPPEPAEVSEIPPGALLIDVRSPEEFNTGALEGAISFPLPLIERGKIPPGMAEAPVVVLYCASGMRSARAVALLQEEYPQVTNLRGGMERWLR